MTTSVPAPANTRSVRKEAWALRRKTPRPRLAPMNSAVAALAKA